MEKRTSKKVLAAVLEVAKKHLCEVRERGSLKIMNSDSLDFIEVSVASLEDALVAAFNLGKQMKAQDDAEIAARMAREKEYSVNVAYAYQGSINGTIDGYDFQVQPLEDLKSTKGCDGGNLAYLYIGGVAEYYNKKWTRKPQTTEMQDVVKRLVEFFKDPSVIDY